MTARPLIFILLATLLLIRPSGTNAQDPAEPNGATEGGGQGVRFADLPWQARLGVRSAMLIERITLVDQVVLVPDLATWLDEVGRWRKGAQWPVLIEDDRYTPLFVRRFKPLRLIRRSSIGEALPSDAKAIERLARNTAVLAWDGDPATQDLDDIYEGIDWWTPPGIVATTFTDPAWPAAVALAAGRGQLLRTLEGTFGPPNSSLDAPGLARLENQINRMFSESGYTWGGNGDDLEALTLCRSIPVRTTAPLPRRLRPNLPAAPQVGSSDPVAVTDLLCRSAQGERWGIVGWIFGKHTRSIYMAMCSLFLERDSVLLVNAYDESGNWKEYGIEVAGQLMREAGHELVGVHSVQDATIDAWRRLVMNGPRADVLFFNTSGSAARMNLANGTFGTTRDIPALNRPLALHMIHSYSLHSPASNSTIGGKWLDRGVYAYVGSCDEPYLPAFIPPRTMTQRISGFTPFLVASRVDVGPMSMPWRIVTIGDPLMLIEPPVRRVRTRANVTVEPTPGSVEVRARTLSTLRGVMGDPNATVDAATLQDLHLLGQDELAVKLWERLSKEGSDGELTPDRARAMLPVFHANRDASRYLDAYRLAGEPDGDHREMLWSLWTPRLASVRSPAALALFERALRPNQMADDLDLLLPAIERNLGSDQRTQAVARAMERADVAYDRDRLKALLK
jgi:hypothetical protein